MLLDVAETAAHAIPISDGTSYSISYSRDDLSVLLDSLIGGIGTFSVLSYFARAERSIYVDDLHLLRDESLDKEFIAATTTRTIDQVLDYRGLMFEIPDSGTIPGLGPVPYLNRKFKHGLSDLRKQLASSTPRIYFPAYNKRKNIAYSSQISYLDRTYGYDTGARNITTLDLLLLYQETGYKVDGPMEIRQAWFYNDLKPRSYYCNGGTSYFSTLYIQDIANHICKFLPSTNPDTRFDVTRLGSMPSGTFLVTYDYTSFTSSLAELKYFCFYLAEALKGLHMHVYDPFLGVIPIELGSYLHAYNYTINHTCEVDSQRFDLLVDRGSFHMGLAGPLGAKGNIVLSTVAHGVGLAAHSMNPEGDCVVGDDALTYVLKHQFMLFVRFVNLLGRINSNKFSKIRSFFDDPHRESAFKFLKRPLDLSPMEIPALGILDFFPDFASVLFPEGDGFHTTLPSSFSTRVHSFISQVSRLCNLVRRHPPKEVDHVLLSLNEDHLVLSILQKVYSEMGLPIVGSPPGYCIYNPEEDCDEEIILWIPPVDDDTAFSEGWIDALYWRFGGQEVVVQERGAFTPPPLRTFVSDEFVASSDVPGLQMMVDLGFISRRQLRTTVVFDEVLRDFLKNFDDASMDRPIISMYTVIRENPHWYDVFSPLYESENDGHDILENMSVLSSVFE